MRDITINANRGTIYDRNMKVLAQSATVWTVFISPADLNAIKSETKREETRNLIAENLSEILEVDKEKVVTQSKKKAIIMRLSKKKWKNRKQIRFGNLQKHMIFPVFIL